MDSHRYVVAGNYAQAQGYARERQLSPTEWTYLSSLRLVRGLSVAPEDLVYVGTYWQRPDFAELAEALSWAMTLRRKPEPEPEPDPDPPALMTLRVAGAPFACGCGCNVFARGGLNEYTCNACGKLYEGA